MAQVSVSMTSLSLYSLVIKHCISSSSWAFPVHIPFQKSVKTKTKNYESVNVFIIEYTALFCLHHLPIKIKAYTSRVSNDTGAKLWSYFAMCHYKLSECIILLRFPFQIYDSNVPSTYFAGSWFSGNSCFVGHCIWAWHEGEMAWNPHVCVSHSYNDQGTISCHPLWV